MSRDREAGASPAGQIPARAARALPAWPLLALILLVAAVVAALLASAQLWTPVMGLLAVALVAAGALLSGAFWGRQRQLDRLQDARSQSLLMGQLLDVWSWQTDAEHRLVRFQPPQGAPASAWVAAASSAHHLWERLDDPQRSLRPRMQAQSPLGELRVCQPDPLPGTPAQAWKLRGLPRFDSRGRFAGYQGVAWPCDHDDARRQAQQALDALLTASPMALCLGTWAADGSGWVMQRATPAACALLGLSQPPQGQQGWNQALGGLPEGLRQRVQAMAIGERIEADGWVARLDGLGTQEGQGAQDQGQPGSALMLALAPTPGAADDTTQSLAAEHAAFSYTISHDLRAPIRVVEGFGRILKEDYGNALDRIGNDHLDRMMAAASRMNHMIDALLSLSRLSTQPLARQSVNLSQLAGWVIDELRRQQPEREVTVHIEAGMQAQGDPTLLRMALENLLGNAWKYSGKTTAAQISFETTQHGGQAAFVVRDNGAGFDMRFADRLFGVFQRLHSSSDFQGNGVGLASVRRIVRRHGGEIWAESEVGQGARFYFTLKGH